VKSVSDRNVEYKNPCAPPITKTGNWAKNLGSAPTWSAPYGLLRGLRTLVLRFAPDRRRRSGDVQPGAAPGSRTVLLSVRGSICSFAISWPGLQKNFDKKCPEAYSAGSSGQIAWRPDLLTIGGQCPGTDNDLWRQAATAYFVFGENSSRLLMYRF
jgi:hypothetical protein